MAGEANGKPATLTGQLVEWGRAAVPAIVGTLGFTGWVSVLGAAVVWMRFSTAGIPADQAVHDLPLGAWLVTGAVSLVLYLVLGLAAVLLVYLFQGVVVSRMLGAEATGDPAAAHRREMVAIEARQTQLAEAVKKLKEADPGEGDPRKQLLHEMEEGELELDRELDAAWKQAFAAEAKGVAAPARGNEWGLLALVIAELVLVMLRTDLSSALKLPIAALAAIGLAAIVVVAFMTPEDEPEEPPEALDHRQKDARRRASEAAIAAAKERDQGMRLSVATGIAAVAIVIVSTRPWTFAPVLLALLLGLGNLAVGRLYPRRFFWYGLSIFASVGLFGAVFTYSRDVNAPSAQPAAILLKGGCAIRGLWVGESSERVFLARLGTPGERGEGAAVPNLGAGRIFWVKREDVATESVGRLQRVSFAVEKSQKLRAELLKMGASDELAENACEATTKEKAGQRTRSQEKELEGLEKELKGLEKEKTALQKEQIQLEKDKLELEKAKQVK